MTTTKKNPSPPELSAADIIKIIDSCKKSGVVSLNFKDLSISLAPNYNEVIPASTAGYPIKLTEKAEDELRELRESEALDELMLANPAAYEEEILKKLANE